MNWRELLALVVATCICAFALSNVGRDEVQEQREYCNNVRDGLWPDFQHSYKNECGGQEPPQFHEDLTK